MIMDLKYHIITIMTVFISLGIGILIGSTMGGNELIIKQQQQLINDLEHKLTQLRSRNKNFQQQVNKLEGKLAQNEEFQKSILPLVVKQQLKNTKLLLLTGQNKNKPGKKLLVQIFRLAGVEKLKISGGQFISGDKFNKVVCLGKINHELKSKYSKNKLVTIKQAELNNISKLIKVVFKLAAKDLKQVRSVNLESFGADSSLQ